MIARVRVLTSHISHDPVLAGDVAVYFMRVFQQVCALKRLVGIHAAFDIAQGVRSRKMDSAEVLTKVEDL